MKELICIVCPRGCHLQVDVEHGYEVYGNACPKGAAYGKAELQHPVRVLTSTVRTTSKLYPRCPVKTSAALPKQEIFAAMEEVNRLTVPTPIHRGQVLIADLLGHQDLHLIATRDIF